MIQASIYGRLGGDPIERTTRNGKLMVTAPLAVNTAKWGEEEKVLWISLAMFGKAAEELLRHKKGDLIAAIGELTRNSYVNREGVEREGWSMACGQFVSARTTRPRGGQKRRTDDARPIPESRTDPSLNDEIPL